MKRTKKLPDYLTEDEIQKILDAAREENYKHWLILMTLWEAGLRRDELVNLKVEDLVPPTKEYPPNIHVRISKFGYQRYVPISNKLYDLLKVYIGSRKGYLFPNKSGKRMSGTNVWLIVEKYAKKAGINRIPVHPHTFRHSRAVYLLKNGMSLSELSKFLGHKRLTSTFMYIEILPKEMQLRYKEIVEREEKLEKFGKLLEDANDEVGIVL